MKDEDYKRQLIIANTLYELGIDNDIITQITTISSDDLSIYRKIKENSRKKIDSKKDKDI
ncbi:MAG: hypothetical protein MR270_01230 [Erysipelotrichaceae bacterium]|nr:hypothetical protein [Erysipelotrichaceae bacterium]